MGKVVRLAQCGARETTLKKAAGLCWGFLCRRKCLRSHVHEFRIRVWHRISPIKKASVGPTRAQQLHRIWAHSSCEARKYQCARPENLRNATTIVIVAATTIPPNPRRRQQLQYFNATAMTTLRWRTRGCFHEWCTLVQSLSRCMRDEPLWFCL